MCSIENKSDWLHQICLTYIRVPKGCTALRSNLTSKPLLSPNHPNVYERWVLTIYTKRIIRCFNVLCYGFIKTIVSVNSRYTIYQLCPIQQMSAVCLKGHWNTQREKTIYVASTTYQIWVERRISDESLWGYVLYFSLQWNKKWTHLLNVFEQWNNAQTQ